MAKPIDSRQAIERVARALRRDLPKVLFVGASAAALYEFGPRTTFLRPTIDVDVATTFANKPQYDQFIDRLRRATSASEDLERSRSSRGRTILPLLY